MCIASCAAWSEVGAGGKSGWCAAYATRTQADDAYYIWVHSTHTLDVCTVCLCVCTYLVCVYVLRCVCSVCCSIGGKRRPYAPKYTHTGAPTSHSKQTATSPSSTHMHPCPWAVRVALLSSSSLLPSNRYFPSAVVTYTQNARYCHARPLLARKSSVTDTLRLHCMLKCTSRVHTSTKKVWRERESTIQVSQGKYWWHFSQRCSMARAAQKWQPMKQRRQHDQEHLCSR